MNVKTNVKLVILATLVGLGSRLALAETSSLSLSDEGSTNTSKLKTDSLLTNKKFEADQNITDPYLAAQAGSLSQYSAKFSLTYYGPMVGDLSAKDQPNPDGRVVRNSQTAISGNVGGQYRITSKDSLNAGTGVKGIYPMQGFDGVETNTPFLSYSHFTKVLGIQLRQSLEADVETLPGYTIVGENYGITYGIGSVYDLPHTKFSLGLDVNFGYYNYDRPWGNADDLLNKRKANNGSLYAYPSLKYNFNSKTQFMTQFTVGWVAPRDRFTNPTQDDAKLIPQYVKESIGVSYSFSRDVYIYPYLNVYPAKLTTDTTTMNVSTVFSLL